MLFVVSVLSANSQQGKKPEKKYQGLLWEITGNGLTKPSYLFGTMHVSNKLAFHLADSFYTAIKSVDVVALETNPANWQDDYSKPKMFDGRNIYGLEGFAGKMMDLPTDYFHKNTFAVNKYDNKVKQAMAMEPAMINGMLYRTYQYNADFEEDTYLDMYIFQTGSKLGKKMTGVEDFEQSEKLVAEAYKDAAKESKNRKNEDDDEDYTNADNLKNPMSLEDAYRKGDLDMLDSLEMRQFKSKAFLEKFLFKRNEIQAANIDSIIKSKTSLFVGVGCAHLPGKRGVIELLRAKGYKLRPVKMGERDSKQKEAIDRTRVPVVFNTIKSDDGNYSVDIPGNKFYSFSKAGDLNTSQYADMSNGAYYFVSRIKTDALLLGENTSAVVKKVDSLLYENIPGKMLTKTPITKNGYEGFDITNKTRRGDVQRYNIIITPFEILFFKISGIGEYVKEGEEANKFFASISIKENKNDNWQNYQPVTGGFSMLLPHAPLLQKDHGSERMEYSAYDGAENNTYILFTTNIHNYEFIEEDSFDLGLMEESFLSSEMIEKQVSKKLGKWQGYPSLLCKYKHKDGTYSTVRYLLQGPLYYAQVAHYKNETIRVKQYFDSFSIKPFIYPEVIEREDTAMKFTVSSPIFPDDKKQKDLMDMLKSVMDAYGEAGDENESIPEFGMKTIGSDTLGEKIFVVYARMPKGAVRDTVDVFNQSEYSLFGESSKAQSYRYIKKDSGMINGMRFMDVEVTDTGSSRTIISKAYYKLGHYFAIISLTDTLTQRSSLLQNFFTTFKPVDTLKNYPLITAQNKQFFIDFTSKDSATYARANKKFNSVRFDSSDVTSFKNVIDTLSWRSKDYMELKQKFISRMDELKDTTLVDYLKKLYVSAKDTADLQNTILYTLLNMQTTGSYTAFKDLIITEPPVVSESSASTYAAVDYTSVIAATRSVTAKTKARVTGGGNGILNSAYDSLELTKVIFPDILQLINLDDYKEEVTNLLMTMVDSGKVDAKIYESYFPKFYLEAKQEIKKEKAYERQQAIAKAEKANKSEEEKTYSYQNNSDENDNALLHRYAVLLLPYWDKNPGVPVFFDDLMHLNNQRLRFNCAMLLLRNKKPVADSVLQGFAAKDKYRIDLYRRLKELKQLDRFPAKFNNQADLVKSAIADNTNNNDTLVLLEKTPIVYNAKKGMVYFFKYKNRKEDKKWTIRSFGIQPENPNEYDDDNEEFTESGSNYSYGYNAEDGDWKLDESKPVKEQLQKLIKKMLFKKHPSAAQFYKSRYEGSYDYYSGELNSER